MRFTRPPSVTCVLVERVIDDFFRLLALVALPRRQLAAGLTLLPAALTLLVLLAARQLVADRNQAFRAAGIGALLARLARAKHAPLRIELVERLGDAVEVELGGQLHARAARADDGRDDRLDLLLQP